MCLICLLILCFVINACMKARAEAAAQLLGRRCADGDAVPYPARPQLHLPSQRHRAGRHAVVARSRLLPPGELARRLRHQAAARRLPISEA
jgi:hypothetical protein